jgi:hypothetical protein
MERTDLMDTSEWAHRALVERLRQLTPEERLRRLVECIDMGREMRRLAQDRIESRRRSA